MKLAAVLGFLTGTAITLWAVLRSFSHGEADFGDPMAEVQTVDPYVYSLILDCE